jgi:hypothetical protein
MADMSWKNEPGQRPETQAADLKMEGTACGGIKWLVYDTFCKNFGPEEKARADQELFEILLRARQRERPKEKRTGRDEVKYEDGGS